MSAELLYGARLSRLGLVGLGFMVFYFLTKNSSDMVDCKDGSTHKEKIASVGTTAHCTISHDDACISTLGRTRTRGAQTAPTHVEYLTS